MALKAWSHKFEENTMTSELWAISHFDLEQLPLCQNCIQGKMTKRSFTAKGVRVEGCLDLIHSDVCGPFSVHARSG